MADNESAAQAARDRDNDDLAYLRNLLPPGKVVYAVIRHVSRSGIVRTISLHTITTDGKGGSDLAWVPSPRVARVLRHASDDRKYDGNRVHGTGMDMCWKLVADLSRALWQEDLDAGRILKPDLGDPGDASYLLVMRRL
jgi:hypothetical protein